MLRSFLQSMRPAQGAEGILQQPGAHAHFMKHMLTIQAYIPVHSFHAGAADRTVLHFYDGHQGQTVHLSFGEPLLLLLLLPDRQSWYQHRQILMRLLLLLIFSVVLIVLMALELWSFPTLLFASILLLAYCIVLLHQKRGKLQWTIFAGHKLAPKALLLVECINFKRYILSALLAWNHLLLFFWRSLYPAQPVWFLFSIAHYPVDLPCFLQDLSLAFGALYQIIAVLEHLFYQPIKDII